jgi:hypothetical protein
MSDSTNSTQIFNESDSVLPPLIPNVDLEPQSNLKFSSLAETSSEPNMEQNHNSFLDSYSMEELASENILNSFDKPPDQESWQESPVSEPNYTISTPPFPTQQIQKELVDQLQQLQQLNHVQSMLKEIPAKQTQKGIHHKINRF